LAPVSVGAAAARFGERQTTRARTTRIERMESPG
jgi:hypothetical protein